MKYGLQSHSQPTDAHSGNSSGWPKASNASTPIRIRPARPDAALRAYEGRVVEQQLEVVWNPSPAANQKRKGGEQERMTRSSNKCPQWTIGRLQCARPAQAVL